MRLAHGDTISSWDIAQLMAMVAARKEQPWWSRAVDRINGWFWRCLGV